MWRLDALHYHADNGWEWKAPDTAGFVLLEDCLGWTVVVEVLSGVIMEVRLVMATGLQLSSHPRRRIAFREEAQRMLAEKVNGGYELAIDVELVRADSVAKRLSEAKDPNYGKKPQTVSPPKTVELPKAEKPKVATPTLTLVRKEPPDVEQPAHEGKQACRRVQPASNGEPEGEKLGRNHRRSADEAPPVDPRQVAAAYTAVRAVSGVSGETPAQRSARLADERAERNLRIAQRG
jgi:hypothetical protein